MLHEKDVSVGGRSDPSNQQHPRDARVPVNVGGRPTQPSERRDSRPVVHAEALVLPRPNQVPVWEVGDPGQPIEGNLAQDGPAGITQGTIPKEDRCC